MFNNAVDREKFDSKFNGFYRGEVVDVNDPLKAGRIKVRVFSVFDDIPVSVLPWAAYADPLMGGKDNGSLIVPQLNSHVYVFFEGGDHRYPVYFAGSPAIRNDVPDAPSESQANYPNNKVIKTQSGIVIEMDDTEGAVRFKIKHPSGTSMEINNDGDVVDVVEGEHTISISDDGTITIGGNATINVTGDTNITSGGIVNIQGTMINLN